MTTWRETPEVQAILNKLGRNPPAKRMRIEEGLTRYFAEVYTGREVARLHRLYNNFGQKVVDTPEFEAWATDSVEKAITDAVAEASVRRRAA